MYEALPSIHLHGRTLDIGGTRQSGYYSLFGSCGEVSSLNASTEHGGGGDIIADCNEPLPLEDASYDNVISLSTFEHVRNDKLLLAEVLRILRPGGSFQIFVPFMYREHGCPYDYQRRTAQWWEESLLGLGLAHENFTIMPLVWDQVASGLSIFEPGKRFAKSLLRCVFCLPGLLRGACGIQANRSFAEANALAYHISGQRPLRHF